MTEKIMEDHIVFWKEWCGIDMGKDRKLLYISELWSDNITGGLQKDVLDKIGRCRETGVKRLFSQILIWSRAKVFLFLAYNTVFRLLVF